MVGLNLSGIMMSLRDKAEQNSADVQVLDLAPGENLNIIRVRY